MSIFGKIFNTDRTRWFKVFDSQSEAEKTVAINKAVAIEIEQKRYCLARTLEGFYMVDDECPHNRVPLSKGWCNTQGDIVCPWHNYQFNLKLGHETTGKGMGVNVYKVEIRTDGLYVGL
jgi:3-phenylpropionate/trans-cinnamate dioxygenase ferredoxin subunit